MPRLSISSKPLLNSTAPLQVGAIPLPELRVALQQRGCQSEFGGEGILVVDNRVRIAKDENNRFVIESHFAPDGSSSLSIVRQVLHEFSRTIEPA